MYAKQISLNEKLDIAKTSENLDELKVLADCESMLVRRAIARNKNIDEEIANLLAFDPVLNVSYMASNNPNCTQKRDFSNYSLRGCVVCDKDERELNCVECQNKIIY
ncbi:hypothetical protein [Malaciobacter canalis]|uniref:hypothetical protein n=1 Tax=Malaciobacter canalis TaxID=1912871 RepID=UPI0038504F86